MGQSAAPHVRLSAIPLPQADSLHDAQVLLPAHPSFRPTLLLRARMHCSRVEHLSSAASGQHAHHLAAIQLAPLICAMAAAGTEHAVGGPAAAHGAFATRRRVQFRRQEAALLWRLHQPQCADSCGCSDVA